MKTAVVYMVAGLSSRFGGRCKQLIKVGPHNESLIELSFQQAIKAGFDEIILIVGPKTEHLFVEAFGNEYKQTPIKYAKQSFDERNRDKPWGTTDALLSAADIIEGPFVVCNGDDLYGSKAFQLMHDHLTTSQDAATVGYVLDTVMPKEGNVNRGIFSVKDNYVTGIVEQLKIDRNNIKERGITLKDLCSMNFFGLHPKHLLLLEGMLIQFKKIYENDRVKESLLPSDFGTLLEADKIKMKIYSTDEQWIGVTNPEDEEVVRALLAK